MTKYILSREVMEDLLYCKALHYNETNFRDSKQRLCISLKWEVDAWFIEVVYLDYSNTYSLEECTDKASEYCTDLVHYLGGRKLGRNKRKAFGAAEVRFTVEGIGYVIC